MNEKDSRIKMINEILDGIKVCISMYKLFSRHKHTHSRVYMYIYVCIIMSTQNAHAELFQSTVYAKQTIPSYYINKFLFRRIYACT